MLVSQELNKITMKIIAFLSFFLLFDFCFQQNEIYYYIVNKGVYVKLEDRSNKVEMPFKEDSSFVFELINDSIAVIQDVHGLERAIPKRYKVLSRKKDFWIKSYSMVNGRRIKHLEKGQYREVVDE